MCSKKIQRLQRIQLVFSTVSFEFKLSINLKIYWFNSRLSKRCQWKITLLPMQELQNTQIELLDWEDPLKEEMAAHSSILAQKISWPAESGRLKSIRLQRVRHDWSDLAHKHAYWLECLFISWPLSSSCFPNYFNLVNNVVEVRVLGKGWFLFFKLRYNWHIALYW